MGAASSQCERVRSGRELCELYAGLSANSDTGFRFKFPWKLPFET